MWPTVTETIGGSAGMVFIPSANFADQNALPTVQRHIYYRLREQDVADDLPKNHYFARSQLAIATMISRLFRPATPSINGSRVASPVARPLPRSIFIAPELIT